MAVISFSGSLTEERFHRKVACLRQAAARNSITLSKSHEDVELWVYNSPVRTLSQSMWHSDSIHPRWGFRQFILASEVFI